LHGHDTPGQFSDAIKAACAANYGTLSRAYIDALTRSRGELNLAQDLAAVVSAWTPPGSSGQVRRVIDRFALAGVAGELAVDFGLAPWAEGEALAAARQCLESWLEGRGSTGDQEDRRAVDTVRAFIARYGSSRFQNIDPGTPERILDRAGFRRTLNGQEQFLFTSDQFKAVLGGLNHATAAKALDRAGLLHRNDGKNLTVRVPLPDLGKVRVYAVTMPDDEGGQPC
jgi:putative DNA primase/helicase